MFREILLYFAKFSSREGVLRNFSTGRSLIAGYAELREQLDTLEYLEVVPEFIFSPHLDKVRSRVSGILSVPYLLRQFDLSGNRKVRVSDDFNIEFRLFRQDVVSDDTGDQVGDKIVDTAMSRVLYLTDIFEHIIDRFDQGSLSQ